MSGKASGLLVFLVLLSTAAAAETAAPPESVTVSGTRLRETFHKFEDVFVTPTPMGGKIARWVRRICPVVVGQTPDATEFIKQRIRYVAATVGARVNTDRACKPNIEIVFTTTPQALLDNVHKQDPVYLGYVESGAQLEQAARITRPIQAWYTTEEEDWKGRRHLDSVLYSMPGADPRFDTASLAGSPTFAVTGSRINTGGRSGFNHILIVVDTTKTVGQPTVPLADYISMLALTQIKSLDACQELPSIIGMLAAGCEKAPDGLTQYDLAYLQGIYRMLEWRGLMFQRNDVASAMADTFGATH
ncbi:MAG: hypothetical protein JF627_01750 [Alphaproteobacteria bacterium]|jgi:hypothetical protein|nr:hypothetical protein [Alphaproteobacteria bacterium]